MLKVIQMFYFELDMKIENFKNSWKATTANIDKSNGNGSELNTMVQRHQRTVWMQTVQMHNKFQKGQIGFRPARRWIQAK